MAYAIEVARQAGVRRLALFHHDPTHGDDMLDRLGREAVELAGDTFEVVMAAEDMQIQLGSGDHGSTRTTDRRPLAKAVQNPA
jgi:ribonuclease BN (tRNA processing enzyme)